MTPNFLSPPSCAQATKIGMERSESLRHYMMLVLARAALACGVDPTCVTSVGRNAAVHIVASKCPRTLLPEDTKLGEANAGDIATGAAAGAGAGAGSGAHRGHDDGGGDEGKRGESSDSRTVKDKEFVDLPSCAYELLEVS